MSAQADIPPLATFKAITCPIERSAALSKLADDLQHRFPESYAAYRRASLREAWQLRDPDGRVRHPLRQLAGLVGLSLVRVWQLTRTAPETGGVR